MSKMSNIDIEMSRCEQDDECPLCQCGTVEIVGDEVRCRGECGSVVTKQSSRGESQTRKFKLHWRDGSVTETEGPDIESAFTHAGFGAGAVGALDYWEQVE